MTSEIGWGIREIGIEKRAAIFTGQELGTVSRPDLVLRHAELEMRDLKYSTTMHILPERHRLRQMKDVGYPKG